MWRRFIRLAGRFLLLLALILGIGLAFRIDDTQRGPPLALWHTYVPSEMKAAEIDAADWGRYLAEEKRVFEQLRTEVSQKNRPGRARSVQSIFHWQPNLSG